jgi:hypothetical protein
VEVENLEMGKLPRWTYISITDHLYRTFIELMVPVTDMIIRQEQQKDKGKVVGKAGAKEMQ